MTRLTKSLALSALTLCGAFAVTAAQASAANFTVNFKVVNNDPSASMIRTSPDTAVVNGLTDPAAQILHGASDPASGNAGYSDTLPLLYKSASTVLIYGQGPAGGTNGCTFTITISHDAQPQPYLLHFGTSDATRCPVPADARSINGIFMSTVYQLLWAS